VASKHSTKASQSTAPLPYQPMPSSSPSSSAAKVDPAKVVYSKYSPANRSSSKALNS
jgi:hypothetical protein